MREKWPRFERIALTLALAAALVLGTGCEQLMEKNKEDDYNYSYPYYFITFDANGGQGWMSTEYNCPVGVEHPLPPNNFTRAGYKFTGWNTASDGSGTSCADEVWVKDLASPGSTVTLYAQWLKTGRDTTITITLPETDEDIELTFTQSGSLLTFTATEGCTEYRWWLEDEELDDEETNTLTLDTAEWQKGSYVLVVEAERDGEYYSAYIYITIGGN